MILERETQRVIMTPDRKCILRGHDKYNMVLCTLDEKSKYKIKLCRNCKSIINFISSNKVRVTEQVKKLYNLDGNAYNEEELGKLISVKVNISLELE